MENSELKKIVANAKGGNEVAKLNLIEKYKPLVNKYAYQYNIKDIDKEDLKQEGNIAILKAIQKFDISNDRFSFDSYVINSIRNTYYDLARKNIKNNEEISLNLQNEEGGELLDTLATEDNLEDEIFKIVTNKEISEALSKLTKEKLTLIKAVYFEDKPNLSKYCKENNIIYSRARRLINEALREISEWIRLAP